MNMDRNREFGEQEAFARRIEAEYDAEGECEAARVARQAVERSIRRREARRAKAEAYRSLGMKRVRGNLGGVYWE